MSKRVESVKDLMVRLIALEVLLEQKGIVNAKEMDKVVEMTMQKLEGRQTDAK